MVASGLEELTSRVHHDLQCLVYPARPWVPPQTFQGEHVHSVVIVGGGQGGTTIAFGLIRERVLDVVVLDRQPAGLEGPWSTFARMHTLRTPKYVTGPDLGIPSLSVRAWYEAKFGTQAWESLGKIPRTLWHDYLKWVRETTGIAIRNETEVHDIEPVAPGVLAVHLRSTADGRELPRLLARKVVLATGIEGSGRWHVPDMITAALPRDRYAHTAEEIDFTKLAGKRIAVLGAGASAFDNAGMALEHGAASIDLLVRRAKIPPINPNRWIEFAGFLRHLCELDDELRWQFMTYYFALNQPPPQDTFDRCAQFPNFHIHLASPLNAIAFNGSEITLTTPTGTLTADFLIVATGFALDFDARPELGRIKHAIARWKDRYTPPADRRNDMLGEYPYLSGTFQFMEREPGSAPYLSDIYSYTYAGTLSLGNTTGISQLQFGVDRVVHGITRDLFVADAQAHLASLHAYDEKELVRPALPLEEPRAARVA